MSVNVNLLELKLKMETQPTDMDLMTHFSIKVEKFDVLRELGRNFDNEGRPNEAADIVLNTIVDPKNKDFKRDYLIFATIMKTFIFVEANDGIARVFEKAPVAELRSSCLEGCKF